MNIYVVMGTTGEYEDRKEWLVMAFTKEDKAKRHADDCAGYALENGVSAQHFNYDNKSEIIENNPYDAHMQIDYTGTRYYYEKVELGD